MNELLETLNKQCEDNKIFLDKISKIRSQMYLVEKERHNASLDFFKKLLQEEYGQDVSEHVLFPIGYNNFIENPTFDEYSKISGFQASFKNGRLVSSGRRVFLTIE